MLDLISCKISEGFIGTALAHPQFHCLGSCDVLYASGKFRLSAAACIVMVLGLGISQADQDFGETSGRGQGRLVTLSSISCEFSFQVEPKWASPAPRKITQ